MEDNHLAIFNINKLKFKVHGKEIDIKQYNYYKKEVGMPPRDFNYYKYLLYNSIILHGYELYDLDFYKDVYFNFLEYRKDVATWRVELENLKRAYNLILNSSSLIKYIKNKKKDKKIPKDDYPICGIYIIRNKINNKKYVGSSVDIYKRWNEHINYLNNNMHLTKKLQKDWNIYGKDNFDFGILEVLPNNISNINLRAKEREWIERLHKNIYNTGNPINDLDYFKIKYGKYDNNLFNVVMAIINDGCSTENDKTNMLKMIENKINIQSIYN